VVARDAPIVTGIGPPLLEAVATHLVIDERDLAHVTVCADPALAIAHIRGLERPRPADSGRALG
jgi:hypothetical protein